MNTEPLYYDDSYLQETAATVLTVSPLKGGTVAIELDRTVFYPEGGGQPSDQGEISTDTGSVNVKLVRSQGDRILHEGKLVGNIDQGQEARGSLKWSRRLKYMRVHTAGHLVHDVLMGMTDDVHPTKGRHGDKAFLEYKGAIPDDVVASLEQGVNEAVRQDLPVKTWESSYEELEELCTLLPPNLPKGKPLRAIRIGDFEPMPDGGVHVRSTSELGSVVIHHVTAENGMTTIRYGVR